MLILPFVMYYYKKNNILTWIGLIFIYIGGYTIALVNKSPNNLFLGIWVFVPYIGLTFILTKLTFNKYKVNPKITIPILIILMIFLSIFYMPLPILEKFNGTIFRNYFSPYIIIMSVLFIKTMLSLDINIKVRKLSQTSYFFYFTHYIVLDLYKYYFNDFVKNYTLIAYILAIVMAYLLAYILYRGYQNLLKILRID